ncbi:MAG: 3-deoxy-manno-octulosonate cytidylyltransferase (CMP-KDO synthetase) [Cryomorphaceae bacterium]|jgi:3-deoxy-manno-octulosonate cytidylyltransferase (CMP-KDO synthetase)
MNTVGIIPARYGSTRFPGKPLALISGKPMIQRVYEQCLKSDLNFVVVATDDEQIFDAVNSFGGNAVMTSSDLPSGTDRCREALKSIQESFDLAINIQGDEPFINPEQINQVISILENTKAQIATLVSPALNFEEIENPNRVKAVTAKDGKALYFSRCGIPFPRNKEELKPEDYLIHLGIYGFTVDALQKTKQLKMSSLEKTEGLEQLRWLQNGISIYTAITKERADSVDTPEDLRAIEKKYLL